MKMRKGISAVLAGVMALAALPVSAMSASAEEAYALGDVDMDGFITGHDAAMVTHALYVDNEALTAEQLKLADVNGDGVVDQSDADWIHENETYALGVMCERDQQSGVELCSISLYYQSWYVAETGAGYSVELTEDSYPETTAELDDMLVNGKMPKVIFNLLDADGNGVLDINDIFVSTLSLGLRGCGYQSTIYFAENRYDLGENALNLPDYITACGVIEIGGNRKEFSY